MYFAFSIKDLPDESIIPANWYTAQIIRCDLRDLKSGAGQRLVLTYVLTEGPYAQRKVDAGFNVDHPNPKAVEISQKELAKVLRACGLSAIQDTLELHDRAHQIRVGVETYKDREQNRVIDWRPLPLTGVPIAPAAAMPPQAVRNAASQAFQEPTLPAMPATPPRPARSAAPAPAARPTAAPAAPFPARNAQAGADAPEPFNDDIPW